MEEIRQKMTKALELLLNELATLKTGRASPVMVEKIMVEAYETRMPLEELTTISTPSPNQLLITPFDQTIIKNIERALAMERNLGLSVIVDEGVIRVNIPPLTEERRQEFIKILNQKLEAGRIMIRQLRHDKMAESKRNFEAKQLNEDEKFRQEQDLQKLTDEFIQKIEEIGKAKEAELLAI
ncbi:MAG: ribosome-recycling factor Frr [Microgenomates group bacterium LiPW_31]|nr:MAG: ribosome-recycling factor Frr [Microgenomates group bacterium LiPW_31]